jgi:hypothetical protein
MVKESLGYMQEDKLKQAWCWRQRAAPERAEEISPYPFGGYFESAAFARDQGILQASVCYRFLISQSWGQLATAHHASVEKQVT